MLFELMEKYYFLKNNIFEKIVIYCLDNIWLT